MVIPFGNENIVVNLRHASGGRFIRVKLLLVVDATEEKTITELVAKQKPFMKTWLIGYLADQSVEEVLRTTGINRIRREIRDQFNALLFPDGSEKVLDVLFDDFLCAMTITPFDFRKPGPVACGLEPHVAGWWRRAWRWPRQIG